MIKQKQKNTTASTPGTDCQFYTRRHAKLIYKLISTEKRKEEHFLFKF